MTTLLWILFLVWFYGVCFFAVARVLASSAGTQLTDEEKADIPVPMNAPNEDAIVMVIPVFNYFAGCLLMAVAFNGFKKNVLKTMANKLKSYMD